MAAYNIPLQVKSPQIDTPAQSMGRAYSIADVIQRGRLQQQNEQENQMKLQEAALAQASQKALNQAIQQNLKQGPEGLSIDHSGVMNTLGKMGYGTAGIKYQGDVQKALEQQAKTRAEQIGADQKALEGIGQTINGVTDETTWQAAKPIVQAQAQKWGIPVNLPDSYDPVALGRLKAMTTTAGHALTATKDANDLARWKTTDLRTGVKTFETDLLNDLAATKNQADHSRVLSKYQAIVAQVPPEYRDGYTAVLNSQPNTWTADVPAQAEHRLTTPGQRIQQQEAEARIEEQRAAHEETIQARRDIAKQSDQTRRELGEQGLDIRRTLTEIAQQRADQQGNKGTAGGKQLTPGQVKVEERNISSLEYGTANRPGLHSQRVKIGDQLRRGVDDKGNPLDDQGRQDLNDKLQAVSDTLQNTQYRKADLYNIGKPNPDDVKLAKDGEEIEAADGALWKKDHGVAYYKGTGSARPPAASPTPAPAARQQPATTPPVAAKKYTEADVRARAKAAGIDENAAVQAARAKGLIQ